MLRNNILLSGVIKAAGLLTSLLVVPATLDYLDKEQYGIWMTISSILIWFSFFDVGLGNGMRNYLAQSISAGDFRKGRIYLSTTLAMLTCIAVLLILVSTVCTFSFDLNKVFNTTAVGNLQLTVALLIATVFTLIQFVVKNVGLVYVAMQRYAINDLLIVSGNVVALIIVYIITKTTETNLLYVVLTFTATPVVIFMLAAIPLFKKHPQLRPSLSSIDQAFARQILGKGLGFFFIQITSVLVIFGGANIFIAQALGQEAVTTYNIAYKFFNLLIIAYTIVIAPMWSAYTDASVKGDFVWIESTLKRTLAVWGLTLVAGFAMLALSGLFYRLWVGESVLVPFTVSCCVFVYASLFNLNSGVTALINGVNKIQVQIITSVVITVLYIVAVSFWGMRHGIEGIVICMAASYAIMSLIHLYQCRLIISRRARGIWNK
jgi:O-antigen/teichoic acid export membrane protein